MAASCAVLFNVGVEAGLLAFLAPMFAMERSSGVLGIRWPRWVQTLPGYTVGTLGAFWTVQRLAVLLTAKFDALPRWNSSEFRIY
jgi:hypothetical protein